MAGKGRVSLQQGNILPFTFTNTAIEPAAAIFRKVRQNLFCPRYPDLFTGVLHAGDVSLPASAQEDRNPQRHQD